MLPIKRRVIESFKNSALEKVFNTGSNYPGLKKDQQIALCRYLSILNAITSPNDLTMNVKTIGNKKGDWRMEVTGLGRFDFRFSDQVKNLNFSAL